MVPKLSRRRDRGGALIVATIMLLVTFSLIGVLLAAPDAQLRRVASSTAKEKSLMIADAAVRDAIMWLNGNNTNLGTWLPQPAAAGGVPVNVFISGTSSYGTLAIVNPAPTGGQIVVAASLTSPRDLFWTRRSVPDGFFVPGNRRQFGSPRASEAGYSYTITPRGAGHYRIDAEGQFLSTGSGGPRAVTTKIVAFVFRGSGSFNFSAMTFANPNNQPFVDLADGTTVVPNPRLIWDTASANPSPSQFQGMDKDGTSNVPGVIFQGTQSQLSLNYNKGTNTTGSSFPQVLSGANASNGSPNATGNNTVTRPPNQLTAIDQIIQQVQSLPNGYNLGNGYTLEKYYLVHDPGDVPSKYTVPPGFTILDDDSPITLNGASGVKSGIIYIRVPDQGSWGTDRVAITQTLIRMNGNSQINGVVILDVGNMAFIDDDQYMFHTNGNPGAMAGSFIFYQRGKVQVETGNSFNMRLMSANGRGGQQIHWSSVNVGRAVGGLAGNPMYKLASYVLVE